MSSVSFHAVKTWFSSTTISWLCRELRSIDIQTERFCNLLKNIAMALCTCIYALVGAMIGIILGAIKGQTTETGLLRGIAIGAMAGAIMGIQLIDLIVNGEPFSKVAFICSLVNGKVFMEWVTPALLNYQFQLSSMETSWRDIQDIFDVSVFRGLSPETIEDLPVHEFSATACSDATCAICLQDLKDGERSRYLPSCRHCFHLHCIAEWLLRQGTCPICRKDVI